MKIIDKEDPNKLICPVFAIYWADGVRYHLVIPYRGYGGLIVINETKCEVTDSRLDGYILKKNDYDGDILLHWSTIGSDHSYRRLDTAELIYRLINQDDGAMVELERRLREDTPPGVQPLDLPPPLPPPPTGWLPPR